MPSERLPPAQPSYVLRGHGSQIHAVRFSPDNLGLLSGDAEGWVVYWDTIYKRPRAVWRAHENAVLGLAWWNIFTVISHGRDSKLTVWNLKVPGDGELNTSLPVDLQGKNTRKPDILYELSLNTLNFCAFAHCLDPVSHSTSDSVSSLEALFLAVPHTLDSEAIDLFQLPSTSRLSTIPAPKSPEMGMVMALGILITNKNIIVLAGYESGHVIAWAHLLADATPAADPSRPSIYSGTWERLYQSQPHQQPVLSLAAASDETYFLTTSADALIVKHPLDGLIGKTATVTQPIKIIQTKHSGQQGLSVRNDGKVLATAGWDARVRMYAGKGLREVAVLKWHKEGCYATAFASVAKTGVISDQEEEQSDGNPESESSNAPAFEDSSISEQTGQEDGIAGIALRERPRALAMRRVVKTKQTHWLAAGAKDGKISLWDVF